MLVRARLSLFASLLLLAGCGSPPTGPVQADLVLIDAKIWTANPHEPWADWIAVRGSRITSIGRGDSYPDAVRVLDLDGRLVVPGFNDTHVHFAQAGTLLLGVNLLDVSQSSLFRRRIEEAARRLPAGSWITGGDWGAYEAWERGSDGQRRNETGFLPSRKLIDDLTPDHPVVVTRFDRRQGLANAAALRELGIESESGILEGLQLQSALDAVPEKSFERRLAESRRALEECRRWGVTTVQDMSPLDQVDIYEHLRERGELTCRIHFSPSRLNEYGMMIERGWVGQAGDEWIRFGTLKTHIDGIMGARSARFFEPYDDNEPDRKDWRGGDPCWHIAHTRTLVFQTRD